MFRPLVHSVPMVIVALLFACQQQNMHPKQQAAMRESSDSNTTSNHGVFAEQMNAEIDAKKAIMQRDFRLYALRTRGISLPGVSLKTHSLDDLEQQCGYQFLPISGDAVRNDQELILRKKQFAYAKYYNQLVLAACQSSN